MKVDNTNPIADLVMAMIAVNQWRIEQSGAIFANLKSEGLFNPSKILSMNHGQLHSTLKRAGYTKSDYVVDLVCDRLFDMAHKLNGEALQQLEKLCVNRDKASLHSFLSTIKGVGPKVFENFCILQDI